MSKGIVLIALGLDYTKLAYNLTKSIKKHSNIKIACITDSNNTDLIEVFDEIIRPKACDYVEGYMFNPFKLKTYLYDYSPFDETIYLDVDAVCLKSIDDLFSDFKIQEVERYSEENIGKSDCVWFSRDVDLFSLYNLCNDYIEYNTSFISFKKSKENQIYFEKVKELYNDRRFDYTKIGKCYPDEMAFGLASSMLNHYPKNSDSYIAFWWYLKDKKATLSDITRDYYFIGLAGGFAKGKLLGYYHGLMKQLSPYWDFKMSKKIFHKK